MHMGKYVAAALVAAAMGTFVPGCPDGGYEPFGRICAAPFGGGTSCVPASEGPAAAWQKAINGWDPPIEMWVERPKEMTHDELIRSEQNLEKWFAMTDTVVEYVRDTQRNAESYRLTLRGHVHILLENAMDRQKELLLEKPADPAGHFKAALTEKASAEKDPLVTKIASDKLAMGAIEQIFANAKIEIEPYAEQYASIAKDFSAYRSTEAAESEGYAILAADASKAMLDGLDGIEQLIVTTALDASAKPVDLTSAAIKLSAQIQQFEIASQEAIGPHADFMATHGAAMPDMTSAAQRSLNAMLGYIQRRVARSDATATALVIGVGMRRKALQMLAGSPAAARAQVASAKLEKASSVFVGTSDAHVSAMKTALPINQKLGLPYLAKRYDELTKILQMQPLCDPASSSWREAGCISLRERFDGAKTDLKTTLPSQLLNGIAAMKAAGVDAALLDAAKAKLEAGDLKGAAILHDAALRGTEGT